MPPKKIKKYDPLDSPEYTGKRNRLTNYIGAKCYEFPDRFDGSLRGGYYYASQGNPCVTEPIFHRECLSR